MRAYQLSSRALHSTRRWNDDGGGGEQFPLMSSIQHHIAGRKLIGLRWSLQTRTPSAQLLSTNFEDLSNELSMICLKHSTLSS